ncbi:MAG: lipocalin-like domain-containing protein [Novosphingobium sp.]|nr:lipocalin-like domain-containing protein [Novosphingobium sp.]
MSGLPPRLAAPDMDEAEAVRALVGGWELVRWTTYHPDGSESYPFGKDAIGIIMYSADGHMSCHLSMANRPLLDAPTIYDVSDADLGRALRAYTGYFGTFSVDAAAGVVTHHVQGAWYPNFAAVEQPRRYGFDGDLLYLEADTGPDLVRITWQRRNSGTLPGH